MNTWEIIGAALGLISVWLTVRQNIWCWPTGLVMVALYAVVFFQAKLYADAGLQLVYIGLQIYGWYEWLHGGKDQGRLEVTRITLRLGLALGVIAAVATALMGYTLATKTDAALPYWDSAATVLSLVAQWMLAKKIIENWLVWITVDVLSIGIYTAKGLYPTTVLYTAFLLMATLGWIEWRKTLSSLQTA
ncbi:MAG TPA: nicotinamide riboside transporter PnuC [Blastocatellia bacterium]|nr:nicotinamide riboside transporter PnuC [Blastocatellia bacterium]